MVEWGVTRIGENQCFNVGGNHMIYEHRNAIGQ